MNTVSCYGHVYERGISNGYLRNLCWALLALAGTMYSIGFYYLLFKYVIFTYFTIILGIVLGALIVSSSTPESRRM